MGEDRFRILGIRERARARARVLSSRVTRIRHAYPRADRTFMDPFCTELSCERVILEARVSLKRDLCDLCSRIEGDRTDLRCDLDLISKKKEGTRGWYKHVLLYRLMISDEI